MQQKSISKNNKEFEFKYKKLQIIYLTKTYILKLNYKNNKEQKYSIDIGIYINIDKILQIINNKKYKLYIYIYILMAININKLKLN